MENDTTRMFRPSTVALLYMALAMPLIFVGFLFGLKVPFDLLKKAFPVMDNHKAVFAMLFGQSIIVLTVATTFAIFSKNIKTLLYFEPNPSWKRLLFFVGLLILNGAFIAAVTTFFPKYFSKDIYNITGIKLFWEQAIVLFLMVIIGPVVEEMLVRGFLYSKLEQDYSPWVSILISAVIFAALHLSLGVAKALMIFMTGVILSYARYKSAGIKLPIILHIINNGIAGSLIALYWSGVLAE